MANPINPFQFDVPKAIQEDPVKASPEQLVSVVNNFIQLAKQEAAAIGKIEQQRVNPMGALLRMMELKLRVETQDGMVHKYVPLNLEGLSRQQQHEIAKDVVGYIRNEEDGKAHIYSFGGDAHKRLKKAQMHQNDEAKPKAIIVDKNGNEEELNLGALVLHDDLKEILIGIIINVIAVQTLKVKEDEKELPNLPVRVTVSTTKSEATIEKKSEDKAKTKLFFDGVKGLVAQQQLMESKKMEKSRAKKSENERKEESATQREERTAGDITRHETVTVETTSAQLEEEIARNSRNRKPS